MLLIVAGAVIGVSLFLAAMVGFVAGAIWLRRKKLAERSAAFRQLAQERGMSFFEKDVFGLVSQLQAFELFQLNRGSRWDRMGPITNVLRGQVGDADVYLFDYVYVVSTGKSTHEVRQTVFFANDKSWYLPNFRLKPETWWHKVLQKIGVRADIDFPDSPNFSNRFWLTGEFEDIIRKKFGGDLQGFLTERPPVHLEGCNYYLIAYKPGKALNADEAQAFFEHCCQITKLLQEKDNVDLLDLAELKKEKMQEPLDVPKEAR